MSWRIRRSMAFQVRREMFVCETCGLIFHFAERLVEEADGFVDVGLGGVEHGGEAKDVAHEAAFADEKPVVAGAFHDLRGLRRGRLFGLSVFDEFESLHQAHAADVADKRIFLLKLFELCAEVRSHRGSVFAEVLFFDQLDGGAGCGAGHRVTAERGDVQTLEASGNFWRGDRQAYRYAVGHALCTRQDVGRDFPLLDAEPFFASAAPAGLHFVGDEKAAVFFHDVENDFEIFLGRGDEAADALDRLGDEGGDAAAGAGLNEVFDVAGAGHFAFGIFQVQRAAVAVRINRVRDADADDRGFAIGSVRGDRFHQRRAAGIGVAQGDDVVAARGHARNQNGGFIGFAAGAGKETRLKIARSDLRDFFSERDNLLIWIERREVLQLVDLGVDLAGDFGIAVAHGDGQDAAEKVEVLAAFDVPDMLHFRVVGDERFLIVVRYRGPDVLFVLGDDFFAARHR